MVAPAKPLLGGDTGIEVGQEEDCLERSRTEITESLDAMLKKKVHVRNRK